MTEADQGQSAKYFEALSRVSETMRKPIISINIVLNDKIIGTEFFLFEAALSLDEKIFSKVMARDVTPAFQKLFQRWAEDAALK